MKKEYITYARYANLAFSFGVTMAVSVFLGLWGGNWLDKRLGTSPWLMVIGILLGVGIAFKNLFDELGIFAKPKNDPASKDKDGQE
jgi:ATP synthase protein I